MEKLNSTIIDKFYGLLYFLKKSKSDFEMVADEIENNSLKTALDGISNESNHFAGELKSYLSELGFSTPIIDYFYEEPSLLADVNDNSNGNELMHICSTNETSLLKAYAEILSENMPFNTLKEIMLFQLNALKYSFMKIKTLNTARFYSL